MILGSIMKSKLKQQQKLVGKNLKENVRNSQKTGRLHRNNREDSNARSNNHVTRRSQYCTGIKSGQINLPKKIPENLATWPQSVTEPEMKSQINSGKMLPFVDTVREFGPTIRGSGRATGKRSAKTQPPDIKPTPRPQAWL